jgi:phage prohead protease, HK97 family
MPQIQQRTNERRSFSHMTQFTTREQMRDGVNELVIEGYFAVFDDVYKLWPDATESIRKGAFSGVIGTDVRALVNHDSTLVLGRTRAGTLTLYEDDKGLHGRIVINQDDDDAMSLYARVKRGDVDQCSFGFDIAEEEVEITDDNIHWTITRVDPLYEVSIVTFPAYEATSVTARQKDFDTIKERQSKAWRESARQKLKKEA